MIKIGENLALQVILYMEASTLPPYKTNHNEVRYCIIKTPQNKLFVAYMHSLCYVCFLEFGFNNTSDGTRNYNWNLEDCLSIAFYKTSNKAYYDWQ